MAPQFTKYKNAIQLTFGKKKGVVKLPFIFLCCLTNY